LALKAKNFHLFEISFENRALAGQSCGMLWPPRHAVRRILFATAKVPIESGVLFPVRDCPDKKWKSGAGTCIDANTSTNRKIENRLIRFGQRGA